MPSKPSTKKKRRQKVVKTGKKRSKSKSSTVRTSTTDRDRMDLDRGEVDELEGTFFAHSPTPAEWSSDSEIEWPFQGIVDHYVDVDGIMWYKVAWDGWSRSDGSNTTWVQERTNLDRTIELNYIKANQAARRADDRFKGAIVSSETFGPPSSKRTHLTLLAQPYLPNELIKLEKTLSDGIIEANKTHEEAEERRLRDEVHSVLANAHLRGQQRSPSIIQAAQHSRSDSRGSLSRPCPLFSSGFEPENESEGSGEHASFLQEDDEVGDYADEPKDEYLTSFISAAYRLCLQDEWDHAILDTGAAPIVIIGSNSEDDPEGDYGPRLPVGFQYLESTFNYDRGVPEPDVTSGDPALGCFCKSICNTTPGMAVECCCQARSHFVEAQFAYDKKGLFRFNNIEEDAHHANAIVYECTKSCSCKINCPNRATQQPRTISIEVFETDQCGWGVRATVPLPRGKVLGFFTGRIITREKASRLEQSRRQEYIDHQEELARESQASESSRGRSRRGRIFNEGEEDPEFMDRRDYIFDIDAEELRDDDSDGDEDEDEDPATVQRYSVDAWASGNWTRFINHSCEPNAKVYTAMVHPPSQDPLPGRIVFVTTKEVPAYTELTIDYNPTFEGSGRGAARRGKPVAPGLLSVSRKQSFPLPSSSSVAKNWDKRCNCESPFCRKLIYRPQIT